MLESSALLILVGLIIAAILYFAPRIKHSTDGGNTPPRFISQPPSLSEWDIKCMAYHEAGHAVCSHHLPERGKLLRITINPSDVAFGMMETEHCPHHNETETSLKSAVCIFLAGSVAEENILNVKTTSCIHDLATARRIAVDMVAKFGMGSRIKKLTFSSAKDDQFALYSEYFRRMADEDIMDILEEADAKAKEIISSHSKQVIHLAGILLHRKTLSGEELALIFSEVTD